MVHGNELSPSQCASIVALHDTGLPVRQIAELSGVSKTAVHKTIQNFKECSVRGRAPETWDWLAVISVLVETFGNYRVVRPLSDCVTTAWWCLI